MAFRAGSLGAAQALAAQLIAIKFRRSDEGVRIIHPPASRETQISPHAPFGPVAAVEPDENNGLLEAEFCGSGRVCISLAVLDRGADIPGGAGDFVACLLLRGADPPCPVILEVSRNAN